MTHDTTKYQHIYKILPSSPPSPLPAALPLSDLDLQDGFIHLSTNVQVPTTASRFFGQFDQLWILRLKLSTFESKLISTPEGVNRPKARIRWETAGDHGTFPHLYHGDLGSGNVEEVLVFERREGQDWSVVLDELPA